MAAQLLGPPRHVGARPGPALVHAAEGVEQGGLGHADARVRDDACEHLAERDRAQADEDVHEDLVVGPVELGADREVVGPLRRPEEVLDAL